MPSPRLDDPLFYAGAPDAALARLRAEDPVHWYEPAGFWALTRHADIQAVSTDPVRFCSGQGVLMNDRTRPVSAADSILYMDPPAHAPYRSLVSRAFTPRRISALEPWIRDLTKTLLDEIPRGEPFDLVDALAAPLPILVIAELLGVPGADREQFRVWSDAVTSAAVEITEAAAYSVLELLQYFLAVIAERRADPRDDLLTALVEAEVDGTRLTEQELLGFCLSLLVAGNETTRSAIACGLVTLAEHPDQYAALRAAPGVTNAVEEILRWVTPITTFARTATVDVEVGGRAIAAGDFVVLVYRAANRDPEVFGADADAFRVGRPTPPHLAFGAGPHFCLGAALARMETAVVLDEVRARWGGLQPAGVPEPVPSTLFHQLATAPLVAT